MTQVAQTHDTLASRLSTLAPQSRSLSLVANCARKAAALSSSRKSVALRPGAPKRVISDARPSLLGEVDLQEHHFANSLHGAVDSEA
jgi:hypothetical protein